MLFTFVSAVNGLLPNMSARGKCNMDSSNSCFTNAIQSGFNIQVYYSDKDTTTVNPSNTLADMAKLKTSPKLALIPVKNPDYMYSLAFKNAADKATIDSLSAVTIWIRVNTNNVFNCIGNYVAGTTKTEKRGFAGYVYGIYTQSRDNTVIPMNTLTAQFNPQESNAGFWFHLTTAQMANLDFLYISNIAPVSSYDTSYVTATTTLTINFTSPLINGTGTTTNVYADNRVKPNDLVTKLIGYDETSYRLKQLSSLFESSIKCNKKRISDEMMKKICYVNEDIKLVNSICECISEEEVECCDISNEVNFECNFNQYCDVAAATCATAGNFCPGKTLDVCKQAPNPRAACTALAILNFYNCQFNNCKIAGYFLTALKERYNYSGDMCLTVEDFCEKYQLEQDILSLYDSELCKSTSDIKDFKKSSKKSESKPRSKKETETSFYEKYKYPIYGAGVTGGLAAIGAIVYVFI